MFSRETFNNTCSKLEHKSSRINPLTLLTLRKQVDVLVVKSDMKNIFKIEPF